MEGPASFTVQGNPTAHQKIAQSLCTVPYMFSLAGQGKRTRACPSSGKAWYPQYPNSLLSRGAVHSHQSPTGDKAWGAPFCLLGRHPAYELKNRHPWTTRRHGKQMQERHVRVGLEAETAFSLAGGSWHSCKATHAYLPNGMTRLSPQARAKPAWLH